MNPVAFHLLGRPIYWFGILVALGFIAAVTHWNVLSGREKRPPGFGSELGFWIMLSGLVCARLAYVVANYSYFAAHPVEMVRFDQGGLIYYGGFIGGCLGVLLFARFRRENPWAIGDLAITGIPLAHTLGRMGCFINGCCFGKICRSELGVSYPPGSPASVHQADGGFLSGAWLPSLPVLPVQLFESGFNLLLYLVLFRFYFRRRRNGAVLALYLSLYPAGRFLLEFLRGDERMEWLHLNVAQWISLGLLAIAGLLWTFLPRRMDRKT